MWACVELSEQVALPGKSLQKSSAHGPGLLSAHVFPNRGSLGADPVQGFCTCTEPQAVSPAGYLHLLAVFALGTPHLEEGEGERQNES